LNKHLEQLVELSQFDKDIVGYEPQIKNEKEKLKIFNQSISKLIKQKDNLLLAINEAQDKKDNDELSITELSIKLKSISEKHKIAKNTKEVTALQVEEDIANNNISFANEEIVRLDNLLVNKRKELETLNLELKEEEDDAEELQNIVNKNISDLENMRNKLFEDKSILVSKVDSKVLTFYEKIKRWANEKAVVEVKNQACFGCYIKLNDRFYSEFIESDEIMTCPECGRIIYKDNDSSEV
jgi:predicted  nucleic acid-binding Zn-ribbon protein